MSDRTPAKSKSTRRRKMTQRRHGRPKTEAPVIPSESGPMRLNRFMAKAGIASRRESDIIIAKGRVRVNEATVTELGTKVSPDDNVTVDGRPVSPKSPLYILLNKPKDTITTKDDEKGRSTVMDTVTLPEGEKASLFPVGRLDRDTTGILLLTNDGDLAHRLMHPRYEVEKLYHVTTAEPVKPDKIDRLRDGVELDDGLAKADHISYVGDDHKHVALQIHEGRNRQVRRMFEVLGHTVKALERSHYAGLNLNDLRRGKWRKLKPHEINALRRKVKLKAIVF